MDMDLSLSQLKELLEALDAGGASEFEYEDEKMRLRLTLARGAPIVAAPAAVAIAPAPALAATDTTASAPAEDPSVVYITSPFVGTFYRAPAPGAEPFTKEGASVQAGQTLCIVEAMKLMNEIEAEYSCSVLEILVENGTSVEFGQKLFKVRKS